MMQLTETKPIGIYDYLNFCLLVYKISLLLALGYPQYLSLIILPKRMFSF